MVTPNAVSSKFDTASAWCLAILTVASVGMATLLALLADAGHDQLWLLLAAQRMGPDLNPYSATVFESNPPLAIWLSAIVVAAAQVLHLSLTVTLKLAVTLIATLSAAVCAKLVRILQPGCSRNRLWLLGIAFILIFGAVPARDFGQREHVLALLVLPYLLAAALDLSGRRLPAITRLAITLAAAVGLALKPHQALIPITIELLTTFVPHLRRSPIATKVGIGQRPTAFRILEPTTFLLSALTYLAAIYLLAPTYLTQILPILRETYWAFGDLSVIELAKASIALQLLLFVTTFLVIWNKSRIALILLAASIAADLAYFIQGTGWYYQQLPAISFAALALILQLTQNPGAPCLAFETWVRKIPIPLAALTLTALALTIHFSRFQITPRGLEQTQTVPDPTFFADLPPGTAVATLTTSVDDTVPPAFRYHLILAQRYPHLWMLPAILRNQSGPTPSHPIPPEQVERLDRLQHQFMVEDLIRWHPALILVARCQDPAFPCQSLEDRQDNLLAWFLRDPAFATIFSKYHFLRSAGPYDAYILN